MRARNIKPGIFKNELLGTADPLLTILFEGLWCLADRRGRLEDRPLRIKAEIFPYRELDVNGLLTGLARLKFIHRYEVEGQAYIQVINFEKHQHPHLTEKESNIPQMSNNGALTCTEPDDNVYTPADSLLLIPDSLIPDSPPIPPEGGSPEPTKRRSAQKPALTHDEYMDWARKESDDLLNNQRPYWETAYPALDLGQEVSKALNWLHANPQKRKKNISRFLANWLSRAQEKGGNRGPPKGLNQKKKPDLDDRAKIWAMGAQMAGAPSDQQGDDQNVIDVGTIHHPDDPPRLGIQYDQTGGEGRIGQKPGVLPSTAGTTGGRPGTGG